MSEKEVKVEATVVTETEEEQNTESKPVVVNGKVVTEKPRRESKLANKAKLGLHKLGLWVKEHPVKAAFTILAIGGAGYGAKKAYDVGYNNGVKDAVAMTPVVEEEPAALPEPVEEEAPFETGEETETAEVVG